jgi:hypothetical protein
MHLADGADAANESIDPSARTERGPQDDKEVFRALAKAGQRLAEIHVHYEQQPEYALTKTEKKGEQLNYLVKKTKLTKDKASLIYNQFLTLSGIPPNTVSAIVPPSNGSSTNIRSQPTHAAASPTTPTARTTPPTFCASLVRPSLSVLRPSRSSAPCRLWAFQEQSRAGRRSPIAPNLPIPIFPANPNN